jgi:hypothetical protein
MHIGLCALHQNAGGESLIQCHSVPYYPVSAIQTLRWNDGRLCAVYLKIQGNKMAKWTLFGVLPFPSLSTWI